MAGRRRAPRRHRAIGGSRTSWPEIRPPQGRLPCTIHAGRFATLRESFSQAVEKRSIAGAADASDNAPMYTLHIGNKNYSTWSLRPWALLSELGIPFEEVNHVFGADFARTIEGKSPTRRVPALHDGKRIVWDSLAIVEY